MEKFLKNLNKSRLRELSVEKIKLAEKPEMKKYLKEFFQNPKKYFNNEFGNKQIIIGKAKSIMERYEVSVPKKFQRRFIPKRKTRTFRLDNETLSEQLSLFNEKRRGFKQSIESSLKEGQRYINDREIEDIFKAFQQVQEINKNKIKDFITTKELVDSIYVYHDDDKIKNKNKKNEVSFGKLSSQKIESSKPSLLNSINLNKSKSSNLFSKSNNNIFNNNISNKHPLSRTKSSYSQYNFQYNKNVLIPKIKLQNNKSSEMSDLFAKKIYDNIENNSTLNSQNTTLYKTKQNLKQISNTNIQLNEEQKKDKEKIKKSLFENEKLIEKQTQYLPDTKQELIRKEMAKRLARQEKALIFNLKLKNKENNLMNKLSKRLKKQKSALILGQIEDYRLIKDIKIKINRLIKKTTPGLNYKWEMDLRNPKNDDDKK